MSVIYKARQLLLNKPVAIKMLHSHLLNQHSIMRFQQEAKAASSLKHPNVIAVHDFGISKLGQPYMVMDFIDGKTLAEVIKERGGALPLPEAMDIFIAVSSALEHAHEHNVLHRDLKPSNIMLCEKADGFDVFLVDFGIAKIIDNDLGGIAQQLTQTGEIMGSPLYMSPEQCMGKKLDQRSDIYSLGCIIYESVAGVPPHRGDTMLDTIFKHLNESAKPLSEVRTDIVFPEAFEDLVMQLLATQAEDRIQSISEVKRRLEAIQAGALKRTLPPREIPTTRFKAEKPAVFVSIGAILCTLALLTFLYSRNQLQTAQKLKETVDEKMANAIKSSRNAALHATNAQLTAPASIQAEPNYENLVGLRRETESVNLSDSSVTDGALFALTNLPNLHSLNLSHTNITDRAVEPILKLNSLTELDLGKTKLSAHALGRLGAMQNLQKLTLSSTDFNDDAAAHLSKLENLNELDLRDSQITDSGLSELAKAQKITSLALSGCRITNSGLKSIAKMKLSRLDLWDTDVTAGGISNLQKCISMSQLRIRTTNLSSEDLRALSMLTKLEVIELYNVHNLKDDDLKYFTGIKSLTSLYIEDCPLTDGAAIYIAQMPQLTGLCLNKTKITDRTLARISNLQQLEQLWIESTQIDDAGMKYLTKFKKLSSLNMSGTLVSDKGVEYLSALPDLNTVDASHCYRITRKGMRDYYKSHPAGTFETHYSD